MCNLGYIEWCAGYWAFGVLAAALLAVAGWLVYSAYKEFVTKY
jgi:hypothetical protein